MIELFEDNAGGLHMTDREQVAYLMPDSPTILADMFSFDHWINEFPDRFAYRQIDYASNHTIKRVAFLENNRLELLTDNMGQAAKRYCGIII